MFDWPVNPLYCFPEVTACGWWASRYWLLIRDKMIWFDTPLEALLFCSDQQ